MSPLVAAAVLTVVFATSALSGVFGMAGGLVLMGALALLLPVSAAFVTHGVVQLIANGWRAALHRRHISWPIVAVFSAGSLVAAVVVALVAFTPSKPLLFLLLALVSLAVWVPKRWLHLDARRPVHSFANGVISTVLNLSAGVAGPLMDVFYVRTELTRHQIVATKAATQVLNHLAKIAVYGLPLAAVGGEALPPLWLFLAAAPLSIGGTILGGRILDRMSDDSFRGWIRWIVTAIGFVYFVRGLQLLF